jgi:hypothetical protein
MMKNSDYTGVECSGCGDLYEVAGSVALPFTCATCWNNGTIVQQETETVGTEPLDLSADEMLSDMQIQLEQANVNVSILQEIQGLQDSVIESQNRRLEMLNRAVVAKARQHNVDLYEKDMLISKLQSVLFGSWAYELS